jgi:hypothetical protein
MARELSNDELKRLARLGAAARLEQLEAERQAILRAFPGLTAGAPPPPAAGAAAPKKKARKRRRMTAEEKEAASERMKQYWATKKQG